MANMKPTAVVKSFNANLVAGDQVRIQILDKEGKQRDLCCLDDVPPGKKILLTITYAGKLEDAD